MRELNRAAAEAALRHGLRAATDVTGFGLVGHALNLARQSGVSLELELAALPLLPGALELAPRFEPGGLKSNRRQFEPLVADHAPPDPVLRTLLYDPQTSGGLLLPVSAPRAAALLAELPGAARIGRVLEAGPKPIVVR